MKHHEDRKRWSVEGAEMFLTGKPLVNDLLDASRIVAGFQAHLPKPVESSVLIPAISGFANRRGDEDLDSILEL